MTLEALLRLQCHNPTAANQALETVIDVAESNELTPRDADNHRHAKERAEPSRDPAGFVRPERMEDVKGRMPMLGHDCAHGAAPERYDLHAQAVPAAHGMHR